MMMEVPIIFGRTGITIQTKAQHDQVWEALEQLKSHQWEMLAKHLGKSLIEIRVRGNVQWRVLGYYGPKGEQKRIYHTSRYAIINKTDISRMMRLRLRVSA